MDYESEQEMEIEALTAILMDEMTLYDGKVPNGFGTNPIYKYDIEAENEGDNSYASKLEFLFSHSPNYPDEAPYIRFRSIRGITDENIKEVTEEIIKCIDENMGMPMILNLIESAKEWLNNKMNINQNMKGMSEEEIKKKKEEEEEKLLKEKRLHGTPVTTETFSKWRIEFENEMKSKDNNIKNQILEDKKLTGKEYFLQLGKDNTNEIIEGEEIDIDYNDDDDYGMLDNYLASHSGTS